MLGEGPGQGEPGLFFLFVAVKRACLLVSRHRADGSITGRCTKTGSHWEPRQIEVGQIHVQTCNQTIVYTKLSPIICDLLRLDAAHPQL